MNRMYIDDKNWDRLINESCDVIASIGHLVFPTELEMNSELLRRKNMFYICSGMLQAFINLENKPIALSQIKNVDESKYFILKWALKQLFSNKRKSTIYKK